MFTSSITSRLLRTSIPASITLTSMFCGYLSVTFTLKGAFTTAAWLIICSGILDAIDGPAARALHTDSKFGGELDSFADLVSFGVAPSLLFYRAYFAPWGAPGLVLSFLPTMISALRLTRFNITSGTEKGEYFSGFTTTASACLLASFLLFCHDLWGERVFPGMAAGLVVVASVLMLSRVRYITITKFTSEGLWRTPKGALCLPVAISVVVFPSKAFFPAMVALMLQGILGPRIEQAVHHLEGIRRQHRSA